MTMKLLPNIAHRLQAFRASAEPWPYRLGNRAVRWIQGVYRSMRPRSSGPTVHPAPATSIQGRTVGVAGSPPRSSALPVPSPSESVRAAFDLMLKETTGSGWKVGQQLQALTRLERGLLANQAIDPPIRDGCLKQLDEARRRVEPDEPGLVQSIAQATSGLSWEGLGEALPGRHEQLDDLALVIAHGQGLKAPAKERLASALQEARICLDRLQSRSADLADLRSTIAAHAAAEAARAVQGQAPMKAGALADVLAALPPGDYLRARRSLDRVLDCLPATPRGPLLTLLDHHILEKRSLEILHGLAQGKPNDVDLVFHGAEWNEDALALKLAAIAPGDERAMRKLDVQHNLRMVARELDAFMASRNAQAGRAHLPVSLFEAVEADERVIQWLYQYAAEEVNERYAQIGAWISLSLFDADTGEVNQEKVDQLLAKLAQAGDPQKSVIDPALLRQHIRAGFNSTAEVVECRELMQKVARACEESTLLAKLNEDLFPVVKAARVACDLIEEVTGHPTEIATGAEVDEALAEALDQAMPWIRHEEDLVVAKRALEDKLTAITSIDYTSARNEGEAGGDREWLRDPNQLALARDDHNRVRNILYTEARIKDLQAETGQAVDKAELARLTDAMGKDLEALAGFSPTRLRRVPGRDRVPSLQELRAISLEIDALVTLPDAHNKVKVLSSLAKPKRQQREQAEALMRKLVQIATLQAALESDDKNFSPQGHGAKGYTGLILKRLDAFGISARRRSPTLKDFVAQTGVDLTRDKRNLPDLVKAFDPENRAARRAARFMKLGGAKKVGGAAPTDPPGAIRQTEGRRRQLAAAASIDRQVRQMEPGESFDIRMGLYGTVSVGAPVVPGMETQTDARAEWQHGLRVSLRADGTYAVRVQAGAEVRHGVTLSALADLFTFRGESRLARENGFEFFFGSREDCLAMVQGLVTGTEIDPGLLTAGAVRRVTGQETQAGATARLGVETSLASLAAQVDAGVKSRVELLRGNAGEVEVRTTSARSGASLQASAAGGRLQGEAVTGVELSVRKEVHRQYGMVRPGSQITLSATVIGGNVDTCIASLLPDLPGQSRGELRDGLRGALPTRLEDGTQVFVRYRLSEDARREANSLLGQASAALTRAGLATGLAREAARTEAAERVAAAHAVTRLPGSYELDGWGWTRADQAEVSSHRGLYRQFARGERAQTRQEALTPEAQGASLGGLSPTLAALVP